MSEPTSNPYPVGTLCLLVQAPGHPLIQELAGKVGRIVGSYCRARVVTYSGQVESLWVYPTEIFGLPPTSNGLPYAIEHPNLRRLVDPDIHVDDCQAQREVESHIPEVA